MTQDIDEALPDWGPRMKALDNDRQRAFVCALFDAPPHGKGQLGWAARVAKSGKKDGTSTALVMRNIGARLITDQRIIDAVKEESHRRLRLLPPAAIQAVQKLIADPTHRDHARAVAMVLDRTDPVEVKHEVNVRQDPAQNLELTAKVLDRIEELARRAGVAALPAPIDAEFAVVAAGEAK